MQLVPSQWNGLKCLAIFMMPTTLNDTEENGSRVTCGGQFSVPGD